MNTIILNNTILSIIDFVNCCNLKEKTTYVKHEDDINYRNNIVFDMKDINFAPEIQWIDCELYEENEE